MFSFVLQFPNVKINEEYKPSLPNFNLNSLINLSEIENLLIREFPQNSEIYAKKTESLLDAKYISVPLNINIIKNILEKLFKQI
jgi:hypothetical protein